MAPESLGRQFDEEESVFEERQNTRNPAEDRSSAAVKLESLSFIIDRAQVR